MMTKRLKRPEIVGMPAIWRGLLAGGVALLCVACGASKSSRPSGTDDAADSSWDLAGPTDVLDDEAQLPELPADGALVDHGVADLADGAGPDLQADQAPADLYWDAPPPMDWQAPELLADHTPPFVVATAPADEEENVPVDFVIRVTFSEPVRRATIDRNTFQVKDLLDHSVSGDYTFEDGDRVVVFTPRSDAVIYNSSPYHISLTPHIEDLVYNNMAGYYRFRFYTLTHPDLAPYEQLAAQYAPHIMQQTVAIDHPARFDYLAAVDLDGDWDAANNVEYIRTAAQAVQAKVYFAVVETKSHFFIYYMYYHPYREAAEETHRYGSDVSGSMVLVQKHPEPRPLAVYTYFKQGSAEDIHAFVSEESGIVAAPYGQTERQAQYVRGVYPAADLFPDGRHTAFLTSPMHQSCLWIDTADHSPDPSCELRDAWKEGMQRIEYHYGPGPGLFVEKQNGQWPADQDDVNYGLESLLHKLWVRRTAVGEGLLYFESYTYVPYAEAPWAPRPGSTGDIGSKFATTEATPSDYGRPPWAWSWKPSAGTYVDMPRGSFFLDPALFVRLRHSNLSDWDPVAQTGLSLAYCFNPYLNIDLRAVDPDCGL